MQPLTPEPQGAGLGAPPFFGRAFRLEVVMALTLVHGCVCWVTTLPTNALKATGTAADTEAMIISDEQARIAAECLRDQPASIGVAVHPELSSDLLDRVMATLAEEPDLRADRVEEARARLEHHTTTPDDVASKMISRIISDSLR